LAHQEVVAQVLQPNVLYGSLTVVVWGD